MFSDASKTETRNRNTLLLYQTKTAHSRNGNFEYSNGLQDDANNVPNKSKEGYVVEQYVNYTTVQHPINNSPRCRDTIKNKQSFER